MWGATTMKGAEKDGGVGGGGREGTRDRTGVYLSQRLPKTAIVMSLHQQAKGNAEERYHHNNVRTNITHTKGLKTRRETN